MPKVAPNKAKSGKKQKKNGSSKLAQLIATAISKDEEVLKEIVDLLPTTDKDDGTANYEIEPDQDVQSMSTNHDQMDTSEDGVSLSTMDSGPVPLDLSNNSVDLGSFSLVHPPIDSKLRQQIWNREFVDLGVLYFREKNISKTTTIQESGNRTVTSIQEGSKKQISTILTWSRAFQQYADVYCCKYPLESSQLFQYMSIIQKMAQSTDNWLLYDTKFRQLRATNPQPWGIIHTETFLFCSIDKPANHKVQNNNHSFRKYLPPHIFQRKGYCWEFQKRSSCSKKSCSVSHKCANCEGQHAAISCHLDFKKFKQPIKTGDNTAK
ncbi:uncharacterized protein LOC132743225 [Ruditapes philippinarum]|uniref:uncharacterized protein LOC132743225 n=1 Tax=Ruditapes philippinarum TaxID=129788 RepID=UPI00295A82D6|nr:uncharacterized protein LOC132743225 [Ruditapes philippinarum]